MTSPELPQGGATYQDLYDGVSKAFGNETERTVAYPTIEMHGPMPVLGGRFWDAVGPQVQVFGMHDGIYDLRFFNAIGQQAYHYILQPHGGFMLEGEDNVELTADNHGEILEALDGVVFTKQDTEAAVNRLRAAGLVIDEPRRRTLFGVIKFS